MMAGPCGICAIIPRHLGMTLLERKTFSLGHDFKSNAPTQHDISPRLVKVPVPVSREETCPAVMRLDRKGAGRAEKRTRVRVRFSWLVALHAGDAVRLLTLLAG